VCEENKTITERRKLLFGLGGAGAIVLTLPSKWSEPIINSVMTPAHAAASACPMIVTQALSSETLSGGSTDCLLNFDVLSSDATMPLSITNITTAPFAGDATVMFDGQPAFAGPVQATNLTGPRVVWSGDAVGGAFECADLVPVDDVVFTITATCDAASEHDPQEFTLTISLTEIIAVSN